jgi:hypothetical protein
LFPGSGDGSTLNLDFTTGVLDSRLTFSRASTATFVNSSGYVQFANANCFTYSNPGPSVPGWNTTGSVSWIGTSGIADPIGGTNAQSLLFNTAASAIFNTAGTTVVSGITHTFSVWLRAVSGTTNARIGSSNTGAVSTVALTTTWQRFSCQYVTNGANDGGAVYSQTGTQSAPMYIWGAQVQPGSIAGDLIQTSGTQNYSTPRFDYSPTNIGEPRGLLIEGQTTNIIKGSQTIAGTEWSSSTPQFTVTLNTTDLVAPDNTNSATKLVYASGYARAVQTSITVVASTTYTFSYWIKSTGVSNWRIYNATGGTFIVENVAIPASAEWQRVTKTFTTPAGCTNIWAYVADGASAGTYYVWGAQIELGSGASSYIPTGASGVTRNKDSMTLSDLSALNISNTAGTLVVDFTNSTENSNFAANISFRSGVGSTYAARFRWASSAILTTYFQSDGSTGFTTNLNGSRTSFARCKAATSYSYNGATTSVFGSMNGAAMSTTSTTTQAASIAIPTSLRWNDDGSTPSATDYSSLVMRSVKYFPLSLTIAQMNTITAP